MAKRVKEMEEAMTMQKQHFVEEMNKIRRQHEEDMEYQMNTWQQYYEGKQGEDAAV